MKKNVKLLKKLGYLALGISNNALWSYAIIGGQDNGLTSPYVALVDILTGETHSISGDLPLDGGTIGNSIHQQGAVAINSFGVALIGESGMSDPSLWYAALIDPTGKATLLSGSAIPSGGGNIYGTAINNFNSGIIGGDQTNSPTWYAALVDPSGNTRPIAGPALPVGGSGTIRTVAINNSGHGILGGHDSSTAGWFAALFDSSGTTTALSGSALPIYTNPSSCLVRAVAINDAGYGLVGGHQELIPGQKDPYLALVDSSGVTIPITGDAPATKGAITSVAINQSGIAVAAGFQKPVMTTVYYLSVITPDGNAIAPTSGTLPVGGSGLDSVAINDSGTIIVGGQDNNLTTAYCAFIVPDGMGGYAANPITGTIPAGTSGITSVAIDNSGAAIIGAIENSTYPYAAVVAPNGVATAIFGSALPVGIGYIQSVAASLLQLVVPTSFGPGNSFANPLFALTSNILPNHQHLRYRALSIDSMTATPAVALVADNKEVALYGNRRETVLPPPQKQCVVKESTFTLWGAAFGDIAHQDKVKHLPKMNNLVAGAILALDYQATRKLTIGGGVAYGFDYIHYGSKLGHANIQEELFTLYGEWNQKYLSVNFAIWGGPYQLHNERHSFPSITSKANVNGWLLAPHLEICTPFIPGNNNWFIMDPFAMFDWANNWQADVKEHGSSGFNLRIDDQYMSLLRSEAGLRLFEVLNYFWGRVILQEKVSYVNKTPFNVSSTVPAFFIGSISTFGVDMFSTETQNLGAVQFNIEFLPCDKSYVYGCINYQGEFGSSFQNNLVSIELGKDF